MNVRVLQILLAAAATHCFADDVTPNATTNDITLLAPLIDRRQYESSREELFDSLQRGRFCADIKLNAAEVLVDAHLMRLRSNDLASYRSGGPLPLMAHEGPDPKDAIVCRLAAHAQGRIVARPQYFARARGVDRGQGDAA
jgi:hypothetical protein